MSRQGGSSTSTAQWTFIDASAVDSLSRIVINPTGLMFLFLTAIDRLGQTRDFICQFDQLEKAFELLSNVVADGDILLHAHILEDDGQRMSLPLEVFDGAPFIAPVQGLEQQWLAWLNPPALSSGSARQEVIQWTRTQISHYETQIGFIQRALSRFDELRQRAQAYAPLNRKPSGAVAHFAAMRTSYEQQLSQVHRSHQIALGLLARLSG